MLEQLRRLVIEKTKLAVIAAAFILAAVAVLVLPSFPGIDAISAIQLSVSIIAGALGGDILIRAFEKPDSLTVENICAFYTNRKGSRDSWREGMEQVQKTLIVVGASAQVLITEAGDIKEIVKNGGRVIIAVPKLENEFVLKFYEELIGAANLPSGLEYLHANYQALIRELEKEGISDLQERIILVEHRLGTPFGMTMYDPEDRRRGLIRVELYGLLADDRPSFDVTRKVNPILYETLGRLVADRLGYNPTQRGPAPDDIARLTYSRNSIIEPRKVLNSSNSG